MSKYDKQHNLVGEDSTIKRLWSYATSVVYLIAVFGSIGALFILAH